MKRRFIITKIYENRIDGYCEETFDDTDDITQISFQYQISSQTISISDEVTLEIAKEIAREVKKMSNNGKIKLNYNSRLHRIK